MPKWMTSNSTAHNLKRLRAAETTIKVAKVSLIILMTAVNIFDIICSHAARHGRDEKLFGKNFPLAREAIANFLAGTHFSEIWFEVPLLGTPRFDLHVCLSDETIKARKTLPADLIDGDFDAVFELYADDKKYGSDDSRLPST